MVHIIQFRAAGRIRFDVTHIALVPRGGIRSGMRLIGRIEMRACGTGVGCAAIAKLMDVKAVFTRRQARDLCVNLYAISGRRE